MDGRTSLT